MNPYYAGETPYDGSKLYKKDDRKSAGERQSSFRGLHRNEAIDHNNRGMKNELGLAANRNEFKLKPMVD